MALGWLRHIIIIIVGFSWVVHLVEQNEITVRCPKKHLCVPYTKCHVRESDAFIYPCHSGLNMICCPPGSYAINVTALENRKTNLFPVKCGLVMNTDKISGGKKADLGQFPWMALLGYRQRGINITQFLCGGSVITESYIMTAAHCINLDRRLELILIRLGEHDLTKNRDCYKIDQYETCADPHIDYSIQRVTKHPNYDNINLQNDIALIKVRPKIRFTDFIRPICLPFERNLENADLSKQKFTISGWGKTNTANLGGSTSLQFAVVTVWNQTTCANNVPPDVQPITHTQLCANGPDKQDSCKGDSGGPLVNATSDGNGELRYFQLGIVSFASTLTCGNPDLPTVYTRVDRYLNWIEENIS